MQTIGILGGVGPEATAELFRRIIRSTCAGADQEHVPVIIFNDPSIPDRTAAILGRGPSPAPALRRAARRLAAAGADFIVIPCNTAHYYLPAIRRAVRVPVLDMPAAAAAYVAEHYPGVRRVGLLATTGTLRTRIYQQAFRRCRRRVLAPAAADQQRLVMEAIYGPRGVKAGGCRLPAAQLRAAGEALRRAGAELIVAGCTEISVVLRRDCAGLPLVDPLTILARQAVRRAGAITRGTEAPARPARHASDVPANIFLALSGRPC